MTDFVDVHLIGLPLRIHEMAVEHSTEVMREFSHLAEGPSSTQLPARLVELDRIMRERFGPFGQGQAAELEAALERGEETLDLHYRMPAEAGKAAAEVDALWVEVDRYCTEGQYLLALASPEPIIAYRRWFLGEFVHQAEGGSPRSWDTWREQGY